VVRIFDPGMRSLVLLLALAACQNGGDDFPVVPQGGPAPGAGGGSTVVIVGRVCVLTDPRVFTSCVDTGAQNITVTVGNQVTTTAVDGSFVVNTPTATDAGPTTITVSGVGIIPSSQTLTPAAVVPALREELFSRVLAANGIVLTPGSGSIMATVVRNGQPVRGVTAISTPSPAFGPFFDGTTPTAFTLNGTGAEGVVFLPGLSPTTPVDLTFNDIATATETTVGGVQVINGGITFTEGILP
jgi:hypothetical protein